MLDEVRYQLEQGHQVDAADESGKLDTQAKQHVHLVRVPADVMLRQIALSSQQVYVGGVLLPAFVPVAGVFLQAPFFVSIL
jgi:hypothetical protein